MIHGHPISEDGRTCIFFAQCDANDDLSLWQSVYETAIEDGPSEETARRAAESYMAGRLRALPTWAQA